MCRDKIQSINPIGEKLNNPPCRQRQQSWALFAVSIFAIFFFSVALPISESTAGEAWVANMKGANVQIIDTGSNKVVKTIPTGAGAHNVTFSPDGKLAFIANR